MTSDSIPDKGMVKIYLTQARAATGAFGLTTALAGVVETQARSISN